MIHREHFGEHRFFNGHFVVVVAVSYAMINGKYQFFLLEPTIFAITDGGGIGSGSLKCRRGEGTLA
jgi:hypothetical protein